MQGSTRYKRDKGATEIGQGRGFVGGAGDFAEHLRSEIMIAWVDEVCRTWGAHKKWIMHGKDGWPERSILGRLIEEGPGAGHESFSSTVPIKDAPEGYVLVSVALQRMAATHELGKAIEVINAHYVKNGKAVTKAPDIGVSVKQYWNLLHTGHAFIAGMVFSPSEDKAA
jgi:hypothetical protein